MLRILRRIQNTYSPYYTTPRKSRGILRFSQILHFIHNRTVYYWAGILKILLFFVCFYDATFTFSRFTLTYYFPKNPYTPN